jgi:hypothetical protein
LTGPDHMGAQARQEACYGTERKFGSYKMSRARRVGSQAVPNYMTWPQGRDVGLDATEHRPLW